MIKNLCVRPARAGFADVDQLGDLRRLFFPDAARVAAQGVSTILQVSFRAGIQERVGVATGIVRLTDHATQLRQLVIGKWHDFSLASRRGAPAPHTMPALPFRSSYSPSSACAASSSWSLRTRSDLRSSLV